MLYRPQEMCPVGLSWIWQGSSKQSSVGGGAHNLCVCVGGEWSLPLLSGTAWAELTEEIRSTSLQCSHRAQHLPAWILNRSLPGRCSLKNPALHSSSVPLICQTKQEGAKKQPFTILPSLHMAGLRRAGLKSPAPLRLLTQQDWPQF